MADLTKRIIFIILYWISEIRLISAHYCEWGLCTIDENCCGPNQCCPKTSTSDVGLYILYLSIGLLLIGALCWCGLYLYRKYRRNQLRELLREANDNIDQIREE